MYTNTWRTSSFSNGAGACVALTTWRRSSSSSPNVSACVELATCVCDPADARLGVRDSKQPAAGALDLPDRARGSLVAFVTARF